jgi:hypothetical protein
VSIRDKIVKLKKGEISKEAERFELKDIDVPKAGSDHHDK